MITLDQMVQREILCCISQLVSTLAEGQRDKNRIEHLPLRDLFFQASELAAPIPDYEEAAIQAGAILEERGSNNFSYESDTGGQAEGFTTLVDAAGAFCDAYHIDPIDREVCEHWIVTRTLAHKLIARGEKVDLDFAGLNVWAKSSAGDQVIQDIYKEMQKTK